MKLIVSQHITPEKNLALEEYFFKSSSEDICLLYRNSPSVIIGKHQNAFAEVNLNYCTKNNMPVLRRISGGGTVYHDLGNINISLIKTETSENKVNYQPLLNLIIHFLKTMDLHVTQGERNDLYLNKKKITGTACHIFKSRTLHHGTILFDADMHHLKGSTHIDLKVETKGVQSKRSSVINTNSLLKHKMESSAFLDQLGDFLKTTMGWSSQNISPEISHSVDALIEERYAKPEWNIDYSPKALIYWHANNKTYLLNVIKGVIEDVSIVDTKEHAQENEPNTPLKGMLMRELILK